ncbi:transcriptional regulator [Marinicella sp. S1101]|uniref:winged helix-turn-helix domain-containing protein n=1 Tax=Marinicella marina TaxID=2996016 RepID=UPI002260E34D|nr:transcriptional regulator [Marinicella marina]MCX7554926.1 transcriptional regulator [Marinicella marina]MDJ1141250.1 transcriptional regulator [Marinicella marina]
MAIYSFGSFQLNTETIKLNRGNQEIELEPQVFNALLYLIENHRRVVTKDELFDELWQGRTLTDNVITRIIYELRKAIDDKANKDSVIRTVRGKGYQFVAAVTEVESSDAVVPATSSGLKAKTWTAPIFSLAALGVLVFGYWALYAEKDGINKSEQSSAGALSINTKNQAYQILSVLPIEINSGNDELEMLVQSLIDYLIHQLGQNFNMKVIHPDSLVSMGEQVEDLYAIQEATRSNFLIQGFIESNSAKIVNLHLTLHKLNQDGTLTPFPLGAFEFPYPNDVKELNALYKQRKVTVRSIVEIIKPGLTLNQDDHFETDDPEAYRLVIAAHHMSRSDQCDDMKRAEELLLKAVARDDEFVYAYLQLFMNYYKRVWICGESTDYHAKGLVMAAVVDRLAPDKFQAMDMRRSTILVESNQVEEAYEFSKQADWNNPSDIYDMSYSLRYAGFLDMSSENIDRILQLDPFFFSEKPIQHAPNTLLYQNRFSEHLALLAEPGSAYHDYFRALNLYLNDESKQAQKILEGVVKRTPEDLFGRYSQALLYVVVADHAAAVATIDGINQLRTTQKHTDGEMTYKLAQLYAMAGSTEQAIKQFQQAVDQGFFPMNYFLIDPALMSLRDHHQFNPIIKQATQRHLAFAQRFGLTPEAAKANK